MEFLIYLGLALGGVFLHIAMKLRDDVTKATELTFSEIWAVFPWKKQLVVGGVSLLTAAIVLLARVELVAMYPITKVSAIFLGYAADSVWKNITPEKLR